MFVAEQQLTSLSPRREIQCNQNMIARGYAAELSVARSTMRVNSPVPAVRRMLSFSAKKTRRFSWVFCCFDREILSHNHYLIARDGYAAELSVARSTNASKLARSRCKANALFLRQKNPTFQSDFLPSKERLRYLYLIYKA